MSPNRFLFLVKSHGIEYVDKRCAEHGPRDHSAPNGGGIAEEKDPIWSGYNDEVRDDLLERSTNLLS